MFVLELSSLAFNHKCKSMAIASHVIAKRYYKLNFSLATNCIIHSRFPSLSFAQVFVALFAVAYCAPSPGFFGKQ